MSIKAMKQALEALEWNLPFIEDYGNKGDVNIQFRAITSLRQAIDAHNMSSKECPSCEYNKARAANWRSEAYRLGGHDYIPRLWVGLTEFDRAKLKAEHSRLKPVHYDERNNIDVVADIVEKDALINAIEAILKEKNT